METKIGEHTDIVKVKVVCSGCKKVVGFKFFAKAQEGCITNCICPVCIVRLYGTKYLQGEEKGE